MATRPAEEHRPLGDYRGRPVAVDLSSFRLASGDKALTETMMLKPRVVFEDVTVAMRLRVARHTVKVDEDSEFVGLVQVLTPTVIAEIPDSKVAKELDAVATRIQAAKDEARQQGTLNLSVVNDP